MLLFAAYTTSRRAADGVPKVLPLSLVAYTRIGDRHARCAVRVRCLRSRGARSCRSPGIVIGNSLAATVLVSRQLLIAATEQRGVIEGRLALGLSATEAFQPHLRQALRTALVPQIESTKAVGIVVLPGAMVGLILAGVAADRCGEGPDLGDVPRARQCRDDDDGDEPRDLAPAVHPRPAAPAHETDHLTAARQDARPSLGAGWALVRTVMPN